MYLLGFNKKIEITKVFLNRGSLIEGIDYLDDIRVVKLMGNGEVIQSLVRVRSGYFFWVGGLIREVNFFRVRSWGIQKMLDFSMICIWS